jgi:hypothetical protein
MTEYQVQVNELITHTLTVEAENAEAARATAYQLLTDVSAAELEKTNDYYVEADGFTGQDDVQEL